MKNCIIAQSGGPTVAINASLAGVIEEALDIGAYETIYGSVHGIEGILEDNLIDLTQMFKDQPDQLNCLKTTPAMFLGSCRRKLPEVDEDEAFYQQLFKHLEELNIGGFYYIGGNDSMDTVLKLSTYAKAHHIEIGCMGIPKTIDNDLKMTDHTPGYGSAAKYVATSVLEVAHDVSIYEGKSVTIVEIMGRDAGWLTAAAALARTTYSRAPQLIYLPEAPFSIKNFIRDIEKHLAKDDHLVVAVSEGIRDKNGHYICASTTKLDRFGHQQLCGVGSVLVEAIQEKMSVKTRAIEFNILQRSAAKNGSLTDITEAEKLGRLALKMGVNGHTGQMVIITRQASDPYKVSYGVEDIAEIANQEKKIPREWINEQGNDVTEAFLQYAQPLIIGESYPPYANGVPVYMETIDHVLYKK